MKMKIYWRTIKIIQYKEINSYIFNLGIFIVLTFSIITSSLILNNKLLVVENKLLFIDNFPMLIPLMTSSTILSLFLTLLILMNISKEKENGIYDLLLVGPVNEYVYVIGKFFGGISIYFFQLFFYLTWMILNVSLNNLPLRGELFGLIISSIVFSANILSIGLIFLSISNQSRNSIVHFIFLNLFLGFIHIADFLIVLFIRSSKFLGIDSLILIRNILMETNFFFSYISPYTNYFNSSQELITGDFQTYIIRLTIMFFQTIIFLAISIWILRKRRDMR